MTGNRYLADVCGKKITVSEISDGSITIDGKQIPVGWSIDGKGIATLTVSDKRRIIFCRRMSETLYEIWLDSHVLTVELQDPKHQLLSQLGTRQLRETGPVILRAPMPGLVRAIEVSDGELVEPGKGIVILEAMKMENEIRSPVRGIVRKIQVRNGQPVDKDQALITIEPHTT